MVNCRDKFVWIFDTRLTEPVVAKMTGTKIEFRYARLTVSRVKTWGLSKSFATKSTLVQMANSNYI